MQSAGRDPCLLTDDWLHINPLADGGNFLVCKVSLLSYFKGPRPPGRPRPSFSDVALRGCQNCQIGRPYRDAQTALERQDLSCTQLIMSWKNVINIIIIY